MHIHANVNRRFGSPAAADDGGEPRHAGAPHELGEALIPAAFSLVPVSERGDYALGPEGRSSRSSGPA